MLTDALLASEREQKQEQEKTTKRPSCPTATKSNKNTNKAKKEEQSAEKQRKTQKIKKELWKIYDAATTASAVSASEIIATTIMSQKIPLLSSSLTPASQFQTVEKENPLTEETDLCTKCVTGVLQWSDDNIPTCSKCGTMFHEKWVDNTPEWKFFSSDEKHGNNPTRCGNPVNPLLEESSIGCKIALQSHAKGEMIRIKKWMDWQAMPYNEKALYDAFQYITTMAQLSGIAKIIIDRACWWYREFSLHEQHRGVKLSALKAASLDMASREYGCPRTPFEIAEIFKIDKKDAAKGCSIAEDIRNHIARNAQHQENLSLSAAAASVSACTTTSSCFSSSGIAAAERGAVELDEPLSVTPSSFMERYCSKLSINQELTLLSRFIAQKIERENLITDNMPHAISAGIIFFVASSCHLPITKTDIKNISGISEVTINKCYKKINEYRIHLLPKCIENKYTERLVVL